MVTSSPYKNDKIAMEGEVYYSLTSEGKKGVAIIDNFILKLPERIVPLN